MPDPFERTLGRLLLETAEAHPDRPLLSAGGRDHSLAEIAQRAQELAAALLATGVREGESVAVLLGHHADHVAALLALGLAGVVWVPVDPRLPAAAFERLLRRTKATAALADPEQSDKLRAAGLKGSIVLPGEVPPRSGEGYRPSSLPTPDSRRAVLFTSGTTGAPKGVIVTERMLAAAAHFAGEASEAVPGSVYLLWEPLFHVGGAQMVPMAIARGARLAMVPRFSASSFWCDARLSGATRIHYLGGILDILLKQTPSAGDRAHKVELAFGAGAKPALWRPFEERFAVRLVEVYGMTEAASFSTVNRSGLVGSIGKSLPQFEVALLDPEHQRVPPGTRGEIALAENYRGLITPGYLDDPLATAAARHGRWFLTGDLAWADQNGNLFYAGRKKEAIRRRGENVSAWEVEQVLNAHPQVRESAVVGVPAEIGEEDILAYVRPTEEAPLPDPADLLEWCRKHLAPFQLPRYISFVEDFARTPSERVRKGALSRNPVGAWDAEAEKADGS